MLLQPVQPRQTTADLYGKLLYNSDEMKTASYVEFHLD